VQGKVKWFSVEKGYGFITGTDGTDRFFSVQDVVGAELPGNGDSVTFIHKNAQKGSRAASVNITTKAAPATHNRSDDRVTCPHCQKKMVPRIITDRGSLSHSVCPFCGGTYKNFGFCFIASVVYGDPCCPEVVALRRYRDNHLRPHLIGRIFIKIYYAVSPHLAEVITRFPRLHLPIRKGIDALIRRWVQE